MNRNSHRSIHTIRFIIMSSILLAISAGIIALINILPNTIGGGIIAIIAGLIMTPLLASPLEWIVHRYVYHRIILPFLSPIYDIHHKGHHYFFFPTSRYVTSGPPRRLPIMQSDIKQIHTVGWKNALTRLAHFLFYMSIGFFMILIPAWLLTHHVSFLIGSIVSSIVISNLFVTVHDTIHRPGSHRLIEIQPWFKFLDNHHYIHHVDTEANVNFLLPLADWLYGTLRLTLTNKELAKHGPLEMAKTKIEGVGEPVH